MNQNEPNIMGIYYCPIDGNIKGDTSTPTIIVNIINIGPN